MLQPDLILASASPRRRELLERIGLCFSVEAAEAEENLIPGLSAGNQVMRLSRIKADAVAYRHPEEPVILSADTVVVLDGAILGKPSDEEDARKMLRALSGRTHHVLTGVTVKKGRYQETRCEVTEVRFESLSEQEISAYIATGEPMDKAGAYGIQGKGAVLVKRIEGSYDNVVGLPLTVVYEMLRKAGVDSIV